MFLSRLIYASTISPGCAGEDIDQILESAHKNNKTNRITGILAHNKYHFLQCLEGSRDQLNKTYRRIMSDSRHHNLVLLDYQSIENREFRGWTMAHVDEKNLEKCIALMHCPGELEYGFDPYLITGQFAYELLREFRTLVADPVK